MGRRSTRRRGVRASRIRLYRALSDAGLRTQAALADRIAELEGLDAAPRDLVSRAFREQAVEMLTLERIARALGVDVVSLLLTAADTDRDVGEPQPDRRKRRMTRAAWATGLAIVTGIGVITYFYESVPGGSQSVNLPVAGQDIPLIRSLVLGPPAVLIPDIRGDSEGKLTLAVRERVGRELPVVTTAADALFRELDPTERARQLGAEVILESEVVHVGRLTGVRAYAHTAGMRRQIWSETLHTIRLNERSEQISDRIALALEHALGRRPANAEDLPHFPLAPVQDEYLQGMYHLDQQHNELNLMRAQSRFEAALRQDSNYARAHAGLCRVLVEISWMDDESRGMRDAAHVCGHALQLAPADQVVRIAHGHFLRGAGRLEESIRVFQSVIADYPDDADSLAGLAFSALLRFGQTGDQEAFSISYEAGTAGTEIDPYDWRAPFYLASLKFFEGNVPRAVDSAAEAVRRNENEMTLANLGTLAFCTGELERARDAYLRAAEISPHSYVGDEFLGMVYYYLGDFAESVRLRRRAIDSLGTGTPEMHRMWGNLADSHRQNGEVAEAAVAYRKAIEILERDLLRDGDSAYEWAARAWYYTALDALEPGSVPADAVSEILARLDELVDIQTEPAGYLRLAMAWNMRGHEQRARDAMEHAVTRCSVYARVPDLSMLREL